MTKPTNADIYRELHLLRKELVERDEMLEDKVDKTYLRVKQYEADIYPIKRFVYGLIGLVGATLITAIVGLLVSG